MWQTIKMVWGEIACCQTIAPKWDSWDSPPQTIASLPLKLLYHYALLLFEGYCCWWWQLVLLLLFLKMTLRYYIREILILEHIPLVSISLKYVGPYEWDVPNLLYFAFNTSDYTAFCILHLTVQVKSTEHGFLNLVLILNETKKWLFILSRMNQIWSMSSHFDYAIVLLIGRKEVLNFLSAQILYRWTLVARLCYIRNMANVSKLEFGAKVMNWNYSVH